MAGCLTVKVLTSLAIVLLAGIGHCVWQTCPKNRITLCFICFILTQCDKYSWLFLTYPMPLEGVHPWFKIAVKIILIYGSFLSVQPSNRPTSHFLCATGMWQLAGLWDCVLGILLPLKSSISQSSIGILCVQSVHSHCTICIQFSKYYTQYTFIITMCTVNGLPSWILISQMWEFENKKWWVCAAVWCTGLWAPVNVREMFERAVGVSGHSPFYTPISAASHANL